MIQQRGWQSFQEEKPLPSGKPELSVEPEEESAQHAARTPESGMAIMKRDDARRAASRGTTGEVVDDAGKKSGFSDAEQQAETVELERRPDEHHRAAIKPHEIMMRAIRVSLLPARAADCSEPQEGVADEKIQPRVQMQWS